MLTALPARTAQDTHTHARARTPVEQRVGHARAACVFGAVHVAPEAAAPLRHDDGQGDVAADGHKHDERDVRLKRSGKVGRSHQHVHHLQVAAAAVVCVCVCV
jgi:hypothetical protein